MNSVEANSAQTSMTDLSSQYVTADAGSTASQASLAAPPSNTGLNDLEAMVAQAQEEISANPGTSDGTLEKVVAAIASIVTTLVSLVSSLLGKSSSDTANTPQNADPASSAVDAATAQSDIKPSSASTTSSPANNTSSASGTSSSSTTASSPRSYFDVIKSDRGMVTVRTLDGFVVRAEGKDQAWSISGPDGRTTRIWGDPHVTESDGDTWDFKDRGTFAFGKNKATLEVVPAGNGQTLSSRLTIYAGDERVTIGGIDTNAPVITAVSHDGKQHDDSLADGAVYQRKLNQTGEAWTTKSGNKTVVMK